MTPAEQFNVESPNDLNAERCAIGSAIIDASILAQMRGVLMASDFFSGDHSIIWQCLVRLAEQGTPSDIVTIHGELKRVNLYDEIGGTGTLREILAHVPSAAHGLHYAGIVRERSIRRQVIGFCNTALARCFETKPTDDQAERIVSDLAARLADVNSRGRASDYVTLDQAIATTWESLKQGGVSIVPTGIDALDSIVGGLTQGEICFLAARPSMGKSTLSRQIAKNVARMGVSVGYISLEESPSKIVRNLLASESLVDNHKIRKAANLGPEEWAAIEAGRQQLDGLPIAISHKVRRIEEIRGLVQLWRAKFDIRLLVIDHIGLVRSQGNSPYERASNASLEVTQLVKESEVAGLVLCQLNRGVTGRDDKRPTMADLRDTGRLEEDADAIVMLHREDYYKLDDADYEPTREAELIIAKWRDSVRGKVVKLKSDLAHQRFDSIEPEIPEFR